MTSKELANHLSNTAVICKLRNNIQVQKIGKLNQWIDKKRISNILKTLSFRIMHRICKRRITILSQQLSDQMTQNQLKTTAEQLLANDLINLQS